MCKKFIVGLALLALWLTSSATPSKPCRELHSQEFCQKIGQMLIVGFGGLATQSNGRVVFQDPHGLVFSERSNIAKAIKKHHVGGVILFSKPFYSSKTGEFLGYRNVKDPKQLKALTYALRQYADYPLWISIDQEGGLVERLNRSNGFAMPRFVPQALGEVNDEKVSQGIANNLAQLLNTFAINVNFAPVVDVNVTPDNPIIGLLGRSFSSNPEIVAKQANIFINAFEANNIIPTLKHFPGHGSSDKDSHLGMVDVTASYQKEVELAPFKELIAQGYNGMIMTAHTINGVIDKSQCTKGKQDDPKTWCPSTLSYQTLTELLRKQLGFKGVIVSDDMTMGAIAKYYPLKTALKKGINAGVNVFILANATEDRTEEAINTIAELVQEGKVPKSRIEESYQYIQQLKKNMTF